jgi:hypothetical protein
METKSWDEIKDSVYGKKGVPRRDELDRNFESLKVGLLLRQARESKNITQIGEHSFSLFVQRDFVAKRHLLLFGFGKSNAKSAALA